MKRINEMFPLVVVLLTTMLTGCPMGSPPPTSTGPCGEEGDSQPCTTPGGCAGIQLCGRGGGNPDLHWSMCTGPTGTCTPGMDAGTPSDTDSGMTADAGMTDGGTMPGTDAGPTCDPSVVRTCTSACGVPGAIGFLLDSCDPSSPCVRDLTDPTGGCTLVTDPFCPCRGDACRLLMACITECDYVGIQTVQDFCRGDACYPVFPESCGPMTDAGMMSGTDAGTMPGTDSGTPGMDAGTPPMCGGCVVDDCAGDCGYLGLYLCVGGVRSDECTTYVASPFGGPTTMVGTGDECRPGREPIPCPGGLVLFNDATGAYDDFCSQFTRTDICGDAGVPDAGTDAGPPPMMDAGVDAGPGMTDAGAGVDGGMDAGMPAVDAGRDSGPPACVPTGPEVCGNAVDEDCSGSAGACPPGVTSSGYYLVLDSSAWCPTGGTLQPRSWDNQDNDVPNTEELHYEDVSVVSGTTVLRVPISSAGHALNWSYTNDTAFCYTGPGRYGGYYSPRLRSATNGSTCGSLGARTFINGVEVPCFICWDTTFAGSVPATTEYRRFQTRLTMDVTAHTGCMSGTL